MFINSQNFDRRLSEPSPKFVFQFEKTQTGLTSYLLPRIISKDEFVTTLEDSLFYELENQLQNGIPLSPVNTNYVEPSELDMTEIVTEKFDALRQSDVLSSTESLNTSTTELTETFNN